MPVEISNFTNILIELTKAVKMHNFYPKGHPQLDATLEKCFLSLRKALDSGNEIKWGIDQKGFYYEKAPLAVGHAEVAALAKKLFFRRIKEITFNIRLNMADLRAFLNIIKLEPEDIQAKGGAEKVFASHDITGILINALRYEDLLKLKQELEEKQEEEEKVLAQEEERKEEEEASGETLDETEEVLPPIEGAEAEEEPLDTLLKKIRKENDLLKYNDLSVRIRDKAVHILAEKKFDGLFPVLLAFSSHALSDSHSAEIRDIAKNQLKSLINKDLIHYLVSRVGEKEEPYRTAIANMLLMGGMDAVDPLLDAIILAPAAITRRHLFNVLVLFGEDIRPLVEARLDHGEWFVTRQMVSLLGELSAPEAVDAIERALAHPDVRVKREALKSLAKINSPRSISILLKTLQDQDPSVVTQAIISLGMLKDASAVDALGTLALKRDPFSDHNDISKEAVKALGIIGDRKAVPCLVNVLTRKVWFGKKAYEEVRSLAVYSLGMIGGPEAYRAIEDASRDSEGELLLACRRILEGREKAR